MDDTKHFFVLQHMRSMRLKMNFRASSLLNVDRDLFLNLGRVQNLSVDVRPSGVNVANFTMHAKGEKRHLGNPVTTYAPNHPRAVFLDNMRVAGNQWDCQCDNGIG